MALVNEKYLEELCKFINRTIQAERIYLFGSYAYGTPNENSDLDILVVIPDDGPRPADAVKRIRRALYERQDMPLDVIACRASMFQQRQGGPTLESKAAREGVLLYGREKPEQRMA